MKSVLCIMTTNTNLDNLGKLCKNKLETVFLITLRKQSDYVKDENKRKPVQLQCTGNSSIRVYIGEPNIIKRCAMEKCFVVVVF